MTPLLEVVELLLTDDAAKTAYAEDPTSFLAEHGLESLDSTDISDAMQYAGDALPLPVAARLDPDAGLESAASLDLTSEGLTLERPTIEEQAGLEVGEDVDFDTETVGDSAVDGDTAHDLTEATVPTRIDDGEESDQAAAPSVDDQLAHLGDEAGDVVSDAELTEFTENESPMSEVDTSDDESLVDELDDLEALGLDDADPGDLDFLD